MTNTYKEALDDLKLMLNVDKNRTFNNNNMRIHEANAIKTQIISEDIEYIKEYDEIIKQIQNKDDVFIKRLKYNDWLNLLEFIFKNSIGLDAFNLTFYDYDDILNIIDNKTNFYKNRIEIYEKYLLMDLLKNNKELIKQIRINIIKYYNLLEINENTKKNYNEIIKNQELFLYIYDLLQQTK